MKRGKTFLKKSLSPYPLYKKLSFAKAHPPFYGRCAFGSLKRFVKRCPEQTIQCEFRFCATKRNSLKKVLEKGDRVRERGKEPFSKGFSLFPGISPYWEQSVKKRGLPLTLLKVLQQPRCTAFLYAAVQRSVSKTQIIFLLFLHSSRREQH